MKHTEEHLRCFVAGTAPGTLFGGATRAAEKVPTRPLGQHGDESCGEPLSPPHCRLSRRKPREKYQGLNAVAVDKSNLANDSVLVTEARRIFDHVLLLQIALRIRDDNT